MKKNNLTGNDYSQEFLNEKQDVKKRITDRTGRLNTEAGTEATKNASGHLQLEGEAIMSLDKPRNALFVPTGAVLAGEIEPRRTVRLPAEPSKHSSKNLTLRPKSHAPSVAHGIRHSALEPGRIYASPLLTRQHGRLNWQ